jgi:hypothetical protein
MRYQLKESAKEKYVVLGAVLLLTGVIPMLMAGLLIRLFGL